MRVPCAIILLSSRSPAAAGDGELVLDGGRERRRGRGKDMAPDPDDVGEPGRRRRLRHHHGAAGDLSARGQLLGLGVPRSRNGGGRGGGEVPRGGGGFGVGGGDAAEDRHRGQGRGRRIGGGTMGDLPPRGHGPRGRPRDARGLRRRAALGLPRLLPPQGPRGGR